MKFYGTLVYFHKSDNRVTNSYTYLFLYKLMWHNSISWIKYLLPPMIYFHYFFIFIQWIHLYSINMYKIKLLVCNSILTHLICGLVFYKLKWGILWNKIQLVCHKNFRGFVKRHVLSQWIRGYMLNGLTQKIWKVKQ